MVIYPYLEMITDIYSYIPCNGGHRFISVVFDSYDTPEGTVCECGKTYAHWGVCPHCGAKVLKAIPINEENV